MFVDCAKHHPDHVYHLLIQTLIPRPIAWVLSDNGNGSFNLAPFSFFNAISADPPIVMISVGWKDDATPKDTRLNIEQRNHFVIHIPSGPAVQEVTNSASSLPHGVSELDETKLNLEYLPQQKLPFIKDAQVAFFCERYGIQEIGNDKQAMILGLIKQIWVSDEIIKETQGRWVVDAKKLNPLARLGGNDYSILGEIMTVKRRQ
jgi:flavin reductase (DIM6/NTAB) family NADH-FMN oxidoreductase RutF